MRIEKTFVVASAGVIAQTFVHWAVNVDTTRRSLQPNGQKYRFDPLNRGSVLRRIKPAPCDSVIDHAEFAPESLFSKVDRSVIKKTSINERSNDFAYWQAQPFEFRLEAPETVRQEYNWWKYDSEQGFQRIYRFVKRS